MGRLCGVRRTRATGRLPGEGPKFRPGPLGWVMSRVWEPWRRGSRPATHTPVPCLSPTSRTPYVRCTPEQSIADSAAQTRTPRPPPPQHLAHSSCSSRGASWSLWGSRAERRVGERVSKHRAYLGIVFYFYPESGPPSGIVETAPWARPTAAGAPGSLVTWEMSSGSPSAHPRERGGTGPTPSAVGAQDGPALLVVSPTPAGGGASRQPFWDSSGGHSQSAQPPLSRPGSH